MAKLGYVGNLTEGGDYYFGHNKTSDKPEIIKGTERSDWTKNVEIKNFPYVTHKEILSLKRVYPSGKDAKDGFRWTKDGQK